MSSGIFKKILTFGSGIAVGYNVKHGDSGDNDIHAPPSFIQADPTGIQIGKRKIVEISDDKIKILNMFEFNAKDN